jgi:hypothetical protein
MLRAISTLRRVALPIAFDKTAKYPDSGGSPGGSLCTIWSKEASQNSVQWAKEKKVPVNDAMIGAKMVEQASLIYAVDEANFRRLEEYGVKILNPTRP